jgi:hypothetical protein
MIRLSPQLVGVFALALIAASGQCVVACSTEACEEPNTAQNNNLPPCHRHSNAPEKQQAPPVCAREVAVADTTQSPISANPTDAAPFITVPVLPSIASSSLHSADVPPSEIFAPPCLALVGSTVLRV